MFGYVKKKYYLVRYQVILKGVDVYRDGQSYLEDTHPYVFYEMYYRKRQADFKQRGESL